MQRITESTKVNEILIEHPELTDYLMELGFCRVDVGPHSMLSWELVRAAEEIGVDINEVLQGINERIN